MKLPGWLGHPYTHVSALLMSLLAALAIVAFMIGTLEYTKTRGQLLLTALLVGGYFLTTLAATAIPGDGPTRPLRPAAMSAATVALLLLVVGLWGGADADSFWKATAILIILTMGLVCSGVALARGMADRVVRVFMVTSAALASVVTVMAALGIALEIRIPIYWWVLALLVLCWLAASAAIPAAAYWRRRVRKS